MRALVVNRTIQPLFDPWHELILRMVMMMMMMMMMVG
jgi:hypothetical protein